MSIFLLHDENVRAAKAALRKNLPNIGSGHLSEAIAAALGFRTHAALIAVIKADAHLPPAMVDLDERAFNNRLNTLNYRNAEAFTLIDLARSDAIPFRSYVEFKNGDKAANNAQYTVCNRLGLPLITVRTARKYSKLEWDCITVSPCDKPSVFAKANEDGIGGELFARFQQLARGNQGNPQFTGSPFTGWVTGLVPGTARSMAEHFFALLYRRMRDHAKMRVG